MALKLYLRVILILFLTFGCLGFGETPSNQKKCQSLTVLAEGLTKVRATGVEFCLKSRQLDGVKC